jgi:hypothetical protein
MDRFRPSLADVVPRVLLVIQLTLVPAIDLESVQGCRVT